MPYLNDDSARLVRNSSTHFLDLDSHAQPVTSAETARPRASDNGRRKARVTDVEGPQIEPNPANDTGSGCPHVRPSLYRICLRCIVIRLTHGKPFDPTHPTLPLGSTVALGDHPNGCPFDLTWVSGDRGCSKTRVLPEAVKGSL